jgi:putative acetyltransferase
MEIRDSLSSDLPLLLDIWQRSVRATHTFLTDWDIESLLPIVRDQVLPTLKTWVLCDDESAPIGFMGVGDDTIEALFIAPEHFRRRGGTMLVQFAKSRLMRPLRVDVNEQNPDAVIFYQSSGFQVIGRSTSDAEGRPFPILHMREA